LSHRNSEEKTRIVLEGLRGESSIAKEKVKAAVPLHALSYSVKQPLTPIFDQWPLL
jgi:hypothetical protein